MDSLVSTAWLADHLGDPDLVVVDATWFLPTDGRNGREEYEAAHIPGAVFFDIDAIADSDSGLPHTLQTAERFADDVSALGISDTHRIVVYDQLGLFSAARVWWNLRIMGTAAVALLDGGLPKWLAENRPVTADVPERTPAVFNATPDRAAVVSLDDVRDGLRSGAFQVVDMRSAPRFRGEAPEPRPGVRGGHMPGALNLPFDRLLADGALLPSDGLRRVIEDAGIDLDRPIVTSCGSGVTAAVLTLALDRLGVQNSRLYDGSWSEWGSRSDTDVTTGP